MRWKHGSRTCLAAIAAATSIAGVALKAHADPVFGEWNSPPENNWPLIAVHAALLPNGRVLTYGTWSVINGVDNPSQQTGFFKYDVWNPAAGLEGGHLTLDSARQTDIFCSSQVIMPETGSVFIAGGDNWVTNTNSTNNQGNNNSNVFQSNADGTLNTLTRTATMNKARWYSSSTALVNGEIYIQGGNGGGDLPEVRQKNGNFRLLSGASTASLTATYPRNFLAPDGRVFGYDHNGRMYYVDTASTGQITLAGQFLSSYAGWTSSAAMFRPGKILQLGGNSNGSIIIDITNGQPEVIPVGGMSSKRQWVSATVLADGRVVATGGSLEDNVLNGVNNKAEVWDPITRTWTGGPEGQRPRMYHSGALLLPDASVLVLGGGAPGPLFNGQPNMNAEIYYPSYLYDAPAHFAARPAVITAPDTLEIGVDFSMNVGTADIRRLTFVKTGSVTHSVNMDQRFIELPFTSSSGTLFVQMTDQVTDMPPGYYLMFAFNQNGVPSLGKIVRVNIPSNPVILLDYTAVVGGAGGTSFQLSCNADEALVGVYGNAGTAAGTYVNGVGLQCIQIDQSGRWIGNPVNRGTAGAATGTAFTKTCARDFAISGFSARSAQYVDQLNFQCRALTAAGKVTGTAQPLGAVGPATGTASGPHACSTSNPVYMLRGRSGSWIESFGMQCREAPRTQVDVNTPPSLTNPGNQVSSVGLAVNLQVVATDADPTDILTFTATGLPPGLGISTSGMISGAPTTVGTYPVQISVSDQTVLTTASLTWTVSNLGSMVLNPMPQPPPNVFGTPVTYTATVQNAINPEFKWFFDDGDETTWSSSPTVTHTFNRPSNFWVNVMARDAEGVPLSQTFSQLVHLPLTAAPPRISGQLAIRSGRLWVVNQDNDTVSVFNTADNQKLAEVAVGVAPRALAFAPDGDAWVTNRATSNITVIDPATLTVRRTIPLPYGSQPYGLVFAPDGSAAFVALEAAGRVIKLDPASGVEIGGASVGPTPRHLSLTANGARLYVSRFVTPRLPGEDTKIVVTETVTQTGTQFHGGEVLALDPATLGTTNVVVLRHTDDMDFENQGSGIPNYLGPVVISPDGSSAWVPSKKDNVKRGAYREAGNLNVANTVRAISSRIDLATNTETFDARIDHDNASMASAAAFDRYGVYMFVALETSREVAVVNVHDSDEIFRINVGRAPQGLAVSDNGYRLYVSNFMDRSIDVFDLTALIDSGQWNAPRLATLGSVASEKLSPTVLVGKQLFYDARDSRLAREGYMSCASCHNDGGGDGRVWDLTNMGEGLRNTISLRGKGGMAHGFLHWSGNFDEVQDFEGQIRALSGGTGLLSDVVFNQGTRELPLGDPKAGLSSELDAMAAYLTSLNTFAPSPHRAANGSLTADGLAGRTIFQTQGCAQCHGGNNFTSSGAATLIDIGTIRPGSGNRLGGPLTGVDPPTLRGVWETAPYLHNGAATTLEEAIQAHNGIALSAPDLTKLVAYLKQIDGQEPAPGGGLVAAYAFDEAAGLVTLDTSGNANTGTLTNGPGWSTGKNGGALQFDGVNDLVRVPDANVLDLSSAATFEAWVYPTVALTGWRTILQKEVDAYMLLASSHLNTPSGGGTFNGVCCTNVYAPAALPVNTWTHLAASYDGVQIRLYVNGVQVATVARTGTYEQNTNPLWIGGNAVYGEHLQGKLDDIRIYNRALSAGEIQTDMNTPVGGTPAPSDTTNPTVSITTPTVNPTHSVTSTPLSIGGTAADNVGVTQVTWVNDRGGSGTATGTASWSVSNIALQSGANVLTVTARDAAGNTSTDTLTVTYTPADTTNPTVSITAPTVNPTHSVTSTPLSIGGTAADNVGVTQVTWVNDRGGSGTATGTTSWTVSGIVLQSGANVLTVTARDAAGNTSTDTLTVTYTPSDTTNPTVSITTPTVNPTHSVTSTPLSIGGTAADNVGVTQVTWVNDRGGSGTATGTTSWTVSGIVLQSGANVLTVTARDAAGNTSTDTLTVTYTPADTTNPTVSITVPTVNPTHSVTATPLSIGGTAADDVGVTLVTWVNDRGGSGTATGTASWSVSNIALQSGANVLTVTARDAAGNTSTDTLTVTYTPADTTNPTVSITAPTVNPTHSVTATPLSIGGTAADNVGVTLVTWVNDRGGSGTATGTASWSVSNIALQSGANVLTVTARDAAGNTSTDTLTVTYTPADTTNPTVSITAPTVNPTHSVTATPLSIGGTAADDVGVTLVTWVNDRGGSGTATGTASWSVSNIALQSGANVLTVTARDAAGNTSTDTLTVTYTPSDTTSPTVSITAPTSETTYTTSTTPLTLAGTAADNVGVTQVTWVNDRGGSGTGTGTTSWTVSGIALMNGANVLTVTARDAAGNTSTDTLTVKRRK